MIILTWEECPRVLNATGQTTLWLLLPGLVCGLHLHPLAPSLPATHKHKLLHLPQPLLFWHPFLHPDHPMNKNENPKMDVEKKRGRVRVGAKGRKTKWIGQDQPGISPYVVPTHGPGLEPSSVSLRGRILSMPRPDHTATQWFHKLIWDTGGKDPSHPGEGGGGFCSGCVAGWRWAVCWGKYSLQVLTRGVKLTNLSP